MAGNSQKMEKEVKMLKEWEKRENFLKIVRREGWGFVPGRVHIAGMVWDEDSAYFESLRRRMKNVLINPAKPPERKIEHLHRDNWGCLWHYPGNYLDGQVVEHPLADWRNFSSFQVPDPDTYYNWEEEEKKLAQMEEEGRPRAGYVEHGFLYLRLTYLRGFVNFMIDVGEEKKELWELRDKVVSFWEDVIRRWLSLGVDIIYFADDLGHQDSLPMSPHLWRSLIKPGYKKIFSLCRDKGVEVYLHTDGYIVDIIPDLIEAGVTILNLQDRVNGLENIERLVKGKIAIDLDIDRQYVTFSGTPEEIEKHILKCIQKLGSSRGGLLLVFGAYPGIPHENITAVAEAMEKYASYWERDKQ